MPCYKSSGCGAYEMRSCRECPASKPDYLERGKKTMIKPRICDVLGIDIGVPFKVKGYKGKYHINSDGVMKWEEQGSSNAAIYEAINHPEHIVKVISLSEQEVEAIKAIKNLFPNAEYVERIKNSNIVGIGNSENGWIADINNMCNGTGEITTIPPSQTKGEHRAAKISEIIRDLQEIQEKYGDVGLYVNPWAEAVNRPVIAAKSSFVDEAGSIQAVIIA